MTDISALTTESGHFTIAALDHRDALATELAAAGQSTGPEALIEFKRDMIRALGSRPSAFMLEPEYSLPGLVDEVADGVGITCALEAQGYNSDPSAGNTLMEGWHPGRVTEVGAHGAKLLVLYRHDQGAFTEAQETLVADVVAAAAEAGVPALIEPVPSQVHDDADRADVIINSARRLSPLGPMILKMPYPGVGRCGELHEAVGEHPWTLLSWGVSYEVFRDQLNEACEAGCAGFTVGRALWREGLDPATRADFAAGLLLERFDELAAIATKPR